MKKQNNFELISNTKAKIDKMDAIKKTNHITRDLTKERFIEILSSSEAGGSITQACRIVNRSRQTILDWRKGDSLFDEAVQKAVTSGKESIADLAEQALIKRLEAGDTTAIIFTLKNLRQDFYGAERLSPSQNLQIMPIRTSEEKDLMKHMLVSFTQRNVLESNNLNTDEKSELS